MSQKTPLQQLRQIMKQRSIDVYLLPRTDQYQSQYLCPQDQRLAFLSGFTGSNAFAVISKQQAHVWTDGRYFLQAQKQLTQGWKLKKMIAGQKRWFQQLVQKYPSGTKIQVDGRLLVSQIAQQRKKLFEQKGMIINFSNQNLVQKIWKTKPNPNTTPLIIHQHAGRLINQKIQWIRQKIKNKEGQAALFTDLGQIAWITNLRGQQVPYNPFFKSILLITLQGGALYLPKGHPGLQDNKVSQHLKTAKLNLLQFFPQFPQKVLCVSNSLNYDIYTKIKNPINWQGIGMYRLVRKDKQIQGFKRCHVVDGVAMAKFWNWRSKQQKVDQYQAAIYLDNLRKQQPLNKGLSFTTISGGGPNGAIIHYHPTQKNSSIITNDMIHLVDSGGQYLDGTTDVTRAFHFGKPTQQQKDSFTRVLLGNLDIQRTKWPKKTKMTGANLDVLARRHLWMVGKDFAHGTGHGVGHYGGVHQGPIGISFVNQTIFDHNMIVTNQPGYYQDGKYGIRIQNMLVCILDNEFYKFQNLTLCPYDRNLINKNLLSKQDIQFIDNYHKRVLQTLSPYLQNDSQSLQWLKKATNPL